jgi:hypothetical protein
MKEGAIAGHLPGQVVNSFRNGVAFHVLGRAVFLGAGTLDESRASRSASMRFFFVGRIKPGRNGRIMVLSS